MATTLCIQVSSTAQPAKKDLEFLCNEQWNAEGEALLFQKLHEILSMVRADGTSLKLNLEIEVKDPDHAIFQIQKNLQQSNKLTIRNYSLSIREIEILGLIMLGYTNQQIADKLFISYETVKSHRKNILTKCGAPNTAALINYYHQTFFEK